MSSAVEVQLDRRQARRILLAGDQAGARASLARRLEPRVDRLAEAATFEEALRCMSVERFDLVIASDEPGSWHGIEFLESVRLHWPLVARVLISAGDDPSAARDAVNRAGVCYWLRQPLSDAALDELFASFAPEVQRDSPVRPLAGMLGESPAMRRLFDLVIRVARTDSTVLVLGETGTGKDLIGRAIHDASPRVARPWCAVNSAAFPETLLESELFGHRRGSFTGATSNSEGLFEEAAGGTVFLDEVAEMPLSMQAKLLRFLQTGEIRAVGSASTRVVDVRLVAATNKHLEREIARGAFREDLYYRLAVIPIEVPPLRERMEDVPLLARHFAGRVSARWRKQKCELDSAAIDRLLGYRWPGNVRELENVIERAVALCQSDVIRADDIPSLGSAQPPLAAQLRTQPESLGALERRHILETLERVGWNRRRAAQLLQISTTTLWRRLKTFGIDGRDPLGAADGAFAE